MFDWNDIRIFLAVAAEGSTLAASRKLNMNQTTVSRRIQVLEHALDLTLFERDTRGYALTTQGTSLIDVTAQMGAAAKNVALRAEYLGRTFEGKIRVTAAHAAMNHWVWPLISGFRKHHPDVEFEINTNEAYVALETGEADLAFRAVDEIIGDTLIVKKLPSVRWGVYCSKAHMQEYTVPRAPKDMSNQNYLCYPAEMTNNVALLKWLDGYCNHDNIVNVVDSIITMSSSLRTEDAVGVLPCVEGDFVSDLVNCFTIEPKRTGFWLVASKEAYAEPRVRKFMTYVGENFPKYTPPAAD